VDPGEEATVDVARLWADDEPDVPALHEGVVEGGRRRPKHCTGVPGFTVSGVSTPM